MNVLIEPSVNTNLIIESFYGMVYAGLFKKKYDYAKVYLATVPDFTYFFNHFKVFESVIHHSAFGFRESYINFPKQITGELSRGYLRNVLFDEIETDKSIFDIFVSDEMVNRINHIKKVTYGKNVYANVFKSTGLQDALFLRVVPQKVDPYVSDNTIQLSFIDFFYCCVNNFFKTIVYNDDVMAHMVCMSDAKKVCGFNVVDINSDVEYFHLANDKHEIEVREI